MRRQIVNVLRSRYYRPQQTVFDVKITDDHKSLSLFTYQRKNIKIFWGDGSWCMPYYDHISTNNYGNYKVRHTYINNGTYTVRAIPTSDSPFHITANSGGTGFAPVSEDGDKANFTVTRIRHISQRYCHLISFSNCIELIKLDKGCKFPDNCNCNQFFSGGWAGQNKLKYLNSDFSIGNNVSCFALFYYQTTIREIPSSFDLSNASQVNYFLRSHVNDANHPLKLPNTWHIRASITNLETFCCDQNVDWDISDFFPVQWQNGGYTCNFNQAFRLCGMTGTIPSWLFTSNNNFTNTSQAFLGCFNLTNYQQIPYSWGGVYSDNDNETTYTVQINDINAKVAINLQSLTNTYINWGDGTKNFYTSNGVKNHYYSENGTYNIKIKGNVANIRFGNCTGNMSMLGSSLKLSEQVTNYSLMFGANMTNSIKFSESLPVNFSIPEGVTTCERMFFSAYMRDGILPSDFKIANSVQNMQLMFDSNTSIKFDISHIFDLWNSGNKNVKRMFSYCYEIRGTVPANKLWQNTNINWTNTSQAFFRCLNLTNWLDIPGSWGGPCIQFENQTAILDSNVIEYQLVYNAEIAGGTVYNLQIISDNLPSGLSIDNTGLITGNLSNGTYTFNVTIKNKWYNKTKQIELIVN